MYQLLAHYMLYFQIMWQKPSNKPPIIFMVHLLVQRIVSEVAAHNFIIVVIVWLVSQPFSAHSLGSLFDRQGFCDSFSQ